MFVIAGSSSTTATSLRDAVVISWPKRIARDCAAVRGNECALILMELPVAKLKLHRRKIIELDDTSCPVEIDGRPHITGPRDNFA